MATAIRNTKSYPLSIEYIKNHRKTDEILEAWSDFRERIVGYLKSNPNYFAENLWEDQWMIPTNPNCLFRSGYSKVQAPINIFYKCSQCTLLGRLTILDDKSAGRPFLIECGKEAGNMLTLIMNRMKSTFSGISKDQKLHREEIMMKSEYTNCDKISDDSTVFLSLDPFTNDHIINILLTDILNEMPFDHTCKLYTFYKCGSNVNSIYEYPTIGSIIDLSTNTLLLEHKDGNEPVFSANLVYSIIIQLLVILRKLNENNFIHGSPNLKSITFFDNSIDYIYNGVRISSPITLKLCNFKNSSITVPGQNEPIRIYSKSGIFDHQSAHRSYYPKIRSISLTQYSKKEIMMYNFNSANFLQIIRHSGLPLYASSFDIVSFMVSLMSYKPFYIGFNNVPEFKTIWNNLWRQGDSSSIDSWLNEYHLSGSYITDTSDAVTILSNKWIRCDALDYLWSSFTSVNISSYTDITDTPI